MVNIKHLYFTHEFLFEEKINIKFRKYSFQSAQSWQYNSQIRDEIVVSIVFGPVRYEGADEGDEEGSPGSKGEIVHRAHSSAIVKAHVLHY